MIWPSKMAAGRTDVRTLVNICLARSSTHFISWTTIPRLISFSQFQSTVDQLRGVCLRLEADQLCSRRIYLPLTRLSAAHSRPAVQPSHLLQLPRLPAAHSKPAALPSHLSAAAGLPAAHSRPAAQSSRLPTYRSRRLHSYRVCLQFAADRLHSHPACLQLAADFSLERIDAYISNTKR